MIEEEVVPLGGRVVFGIFVGIAAVGDNVGTAVGMIVAVGVDTDGVRDGETDGAKVGVACILVAGYYEKIRQLTRQQVTERLKASMLPDRAQEVQRIRAGYGPIAEKVIAEQAPFLEMSEHSYGLLKQKIIDRWADILDIASTVPASRELADLLREVGGPVNAQLIGLEGEEVRLGLEYSHYLRNRFTVIKLSRIIGIQ